MRAVVAMGSSFTLSRTHQQGIAVIAALCCQSRFRQNVQRPLSVEASAKHSFKRQLHTTPVGAVGAFGWNPTALTFFAAEAVGLCDLL